MLYSTSSYDGQLKFDDSAYYVKKAVVCNKPWIHGNVSDIEDRLSCMDAFCGSGLHSGTVTVYSSYFLLGRNIMDKRGG